MSILGSVLSIVDWAKDKIPIQDRKERWKNEYDNLTKEKDEIFKSQPDIKKSWRLDYINKRLSDLDQLFRNQTSS